MSYTRDSASDLAWNEGSQSYVPASVPPTEYTCDRDTTLDIYESALDPDTVYNVTDQQDSFINIIRDTIWPVGSLYLGMMEVCPLAALFGTWVKVSSGRVLQGADDSHLAGTTIEPGLPNITGTADVAQGSSRSYNATGAFFQTNNGNGGNWDTAASCKLNIDASRSSSIYGKSDTVQPPALVVNIWQRIA